MLIMLCIDYFGRKQLDYAKIVYNIFDSDQLAY